MKADELVEVVAVALSMADPDERGLPEGEQMAPFYCKLAHAALSAARPVIERETLERAAKALIEAHPKALSKDELAFRVDMAATGGSFGFRRT